MSEINIDMAVEAHEYFTGKNTPPSEGISFKSRRFGGLTHTEIKVTSAEGAEYIGKPIGSYITFESEDLRGSVGESHKQSKNFIAREIQLLLAKNKIEKTDPVLVVGLGNRAVTPDALGPKTVSALFVSRHLFEHLPGITSENMRPVSALSPGVLGTTGIETLEIIKGITERVLPKCIITVDALVARDINRLGKSLQICDSGITPGSGVGNHRKGLSRETLGVPVISVGVPTVVSAATIVENILEKEGCFSPQKLCGEDMIVTPKDIDELISDLSDVISSALNTALQPNDIVASLM